jgi:hypothetical protein
VVLAGLSSGDTIVTSGTHKVLEGGGIESQTLPAVASEIR